MASLLAPLIRAGLTRPLTRPLDSNAPLEGVGSPELIVNGDFSNGAAAWTDVSTAPATASAAGGLGTLSADGTHRARYRQAFGPTISGRTYHLTMDRGGLGVEVALGSTAGGTDILNLNTPATGVLDTTFVASGATTNLQVSRLANGAGTFDNVSVRLIVLAAFALVSLFAYDGSSMVAFDGTPVLTSML